MDRINGKRREKLLAFGQSLTQLGMGLMLESEGDANGALRSYARAQRPPAEGDPNSLGCWRYPFLSEAYALSARLQIKSGRIDGARRTLEEGRLRCPGDPLVALVFAEYDRTVGARADAAGELSGVLRFLRGNAAWVDARARTLAEGLGRELMKDGFDPRALGEFAGLIERHARAARDPAVAADLFVLLGDARLKLGQNASAQAAFRHSLRLVPANGSIRRYVGRRLWLGAARAALASGAPESARAAALLQCARLAAADESFLLLPETESLRRSDVGGPASSVAVNPIARDFWRGGRELDDGELVHAEALFVDILAREPGSIAGWAGMEQVRAREGRPISSLWYFERVQRAVGHIYYPILHAPLGRISAELRRGVPDAAMKPTVYGLTALMPEYTDVIWTTYSGILLERGRPAQARAAALFALAHARPQHHPEWPLLVLAGISAAQREPADMWSYFNRAQEMKPGSLKMVCVRLEFDRMYGRPEDALRTAKRLRAMSTDIDDPGLRSLLKRLVRSDPATTPSEFKAAFKDGLDCGLSLP